MRATLSGYYRNLQFDQSKVAKELFDVSKQISSGQKIQYAHEDTATFINTVRLDNEVTTLTQVKQNALKAVQFSTNTDTTMSEMSKILDAMKVKLVSAASDSNSPENLRAIGKELRGLENNLMQLANTSIDGKYLFSGSEIKTKPIDGNGIYRGNDESIKAFIGSGIEQAYNVSGSDLFLGEDNSIKRHISTNIGIINKTELYPHIMGDSNTVLDSKKVYIGEKNTIRDLVGDIHNQNDLDMGLQNYKTTHFYVRGTDHDGNTFKQRITMDGSESIAALLDKIGEAYGNTAQNDLVEVSLNAHGQIEILDKLPGSSKLDFHMVAATDFDLGDADDANVVNLDALDSGTTSLSEIINGVSSNKLLITEFMKSGLSVSSDADRIEGLRYDEFNFSKDGVYLNSNISQIVKSDNSYANASTKIADVVSGVTAVGNVLDLKGSTINGIAYDIQINLSTPGSFVSGSMNGIAIDNFGIFNTDTPRTAVHPDEMTYQQLNDVINMVVTGVVPNGTNIDPATGLLFVNPVDEYDYILRHSYDKGETRLDHQGKLSFKEKNSSSTVTSATLSLSDRDAANFFSDTKAEGSALSFQNNSALTISDAKTDFFRQIDEAISAVELGRSRADGEGNDPRNAGIQNAIKTIDNLSFHFSNQHSIVGVQSQTLQRTSDRTDMLLITTQVLRSETIDVDFAQASLALKQLELNYQAMLSTVSRISQLSLVNYL